MRWAILFSVAFWSLVIWLLVGCDTPPKCPDARGKCTAEVVVPAPAILPFVLKGSVTSAFAVTVDGERYDDMELYYTAEINRLDEKVAQAGYPGYQAKLDAQVGWSDLATGMTVYVTPASNRGYQGRTTVQPDGTFQLTLPADAAGEFQVKATKRISLTLTKDKDVKRFCWNFSGVDLQVPYEAKDRPIVLSNFKSTVTEYACTSDSPTLQIPVAPPKPTTTAVETPGEAIVLPRGPALTRLDGKILQGDKVLWSPGDPEDKEVRGSPVWNYAINGDGKVCWATNSFMDSITEILHSSVAAIVCK